MGAKTQILLVIALLAGPAQAAERVDAGQHSAFWLWSGVKAGDELQNAHTVYLHQGEVVTRAGEVVFQRLGLPVSRLTFPTIWLTVRFTTLDVPPAIVPRIVRLMQRWQAAGNQVVGLQVDFDAATYQLSDYANFLQQLRQQLPAEFALGVTGLLDWAKTGDIATLNTLAVDELVVQSYQGRRTVANYQAYLPALNRLRIPFKLGLVQHGSRDRLAERQLENSPYYRGTVVFMLNPTRR
ncbi:hypothetical protein SB6095_00469 [Klebsiella quasivariicola]|mgnify:CR=1 FL=1|uniref:DUF3142 domain-containing protein n=1 Tax=Klebsiella TaxID=570 RepID=UPI000E2D23E4|nr:MULTISPECIES: DUF3142 domain-containing protein [Klebsiella]MEA1147529.1 DUF3142 domain-containing protein [Klebsiella pneumoniae]MBS5207082.1 DUF3142 domain-containing protein [Klebsiella sp.]MDF2005207.1 DUF3142 domain-containing protein [Klebsiella quasivariicola]MDK6604660.1 DUF3142 domain-containing protein [Klebsiella quasivariicola]MDK7205140.1 DUF3142 domain-containing protein [Klebsiella quasivariicola]